MEEVNEMALTSQIADNLPRIDFDYSQYDEETVNVMQDAENIMQVSGANVKMIWGEQLNRVREQLVTKNSYDGKCFEDWFIALNLRKNFVYDTISYYKARVVGANSCLLDGLSDSKISAIGKLPENLQKDVLEKAPIKDMTVDDVRTLTRQVKKTGEYNEDLLNEIRQKDDKIKTKEAETKQLQQEKEQKNQEIAELKAKLQKMEEEKVQSVAQVEPEVVEKIVEVEKVVEKEVIPDEIQEELKELRAEKKRLEQETAEKTEYIKQQDEKLQEKEDSLNNLKINKNTNQTENLNVIDIGILFTIIKDFLTRASSYTLLKGQYEDIPPKTKKTLEDAIKSVEDWCILMEQAVNSDFQNVGNNIIIESEND